jgi:hypothetical protein
VINGHPVATSMSSEVLSSRARSALPSARQALLQMAVGQPVHGGRASGWRREDLD